MLITIIGNDFKKKTRKVKEVMKGLELKRPHANISHYDFLDLKNSQKLSELVGTQGGLFEEKNIIKLTNIFIDQKIKKDFLSKIEEIKNSENAFVLIEEKITATEIKKLKENSLQFHEFKTNKKEPFNIFELVSNIQNKDRKKLWLNFHLAQNSGISVDEIFPKFTYAFKTIMLFQKFSEKDSGLKPYPYKLAKQSAHNFPNNSAQKNFKKLINLFNKSRKGESKLKNSLEKFILEL